MYRVLVTGVGAIIGYGIVNSLRQTNKSIYILGMDIYDDAVGQNWCDDFIQSIPALNTEYPNFLLSVIKNYNIDIVFFGTEQEIYRMVKEKKNFSEYKKLVINKENILDLSYDKWKTYNYLVDNYKEEYAIPSIIEGSFEDISEKFGLPFLIKPRHSYASKGIIKVSDIETFKFWQNALGDNFMAQKIVGNNEQEYTSAVFGYGDGSYLQSISLRRKLSGEGSTVKATVIKDNKLDSVIDDLTKLFKPIGPINYQFRLDKGNYLLLEINPRISSSTSLRTKFGYNESEICIDYFLEKKKLLKKEIKNGIATRYIADLVKYI